MLVLDGAGGYPFAPLGCLELTRVAKPVRIGNLSCEMSLAYFALRGSTLIAQNEKDPIK